MGRQLEDLLDGTLNEAEAAALSQRLTQDAAARRFYVEHMARVADLEDVSQSDGADVPTHPHPMPMPVFRRRALAAAAVLALGGMMWWALGAPTAKPAGPGGTVVPTCATLAALDGTVSTDDGTALSVGDVLKPGAIRVEGLAEVVTRAGVTLSLEGPARLTLDTSNRAVLHRGHLLAEVPQRAHGFTVQAPRATVVDLGTRFGVSAEADQPTAVHVFQGRVRVDGGPANRSSRTLSAGEAVAIDDRDRVRPMAAQRSAFVEAGAVRAAPAYRRWIRHSRRMVRDESVMYYRDFRFAETGVRSAPGRWPNKWAAEFHQPGDGLPLTIDGSHRQLSLAAWVRFDRFDQPFHSVLMSDGWDRGDVHWQVHRRAADDIRLEFSVKHRGPFSENQSTKSDYFSDDALDDSDADRWVHLAVVYDQLRGRVMHFVDGRPVGSEPVREADPVLLVGPAQLGNWDRPHERDINPVRVLIGRLDEMAVWRRALTPKEIRRMADAGRPDESR